MKSLFNAIIILLIIGVFLAVGIVLSAFSAVIAGAFYIVEIIAAVIMVVIIVVGIIGGMIAVLFSPNEEKKGTKND